MRLKVTGLPGTTWTLLLPSILCFLYLSHIVNGAFKDEQYLDSISCSSRHKISLLSNKTLIIKLSRWADYHRGLSFLNFQCKFQVIAPKGYGIMAIVQVLHLRTKNMQYSGCRDSIKLENSDGLETGPICGEIGEGDRTEKPRTLVGQRSFYDPKGILDVAFKFDDSQIDDVQKPFQLELSFTAYTECTSTSLLTRTVRQCSATRPYSCIAQNLFCDGVINCGHRGDFGLDETSCGAPPRNDHVLTPVNNPPPPPLTHDGPIHRIDLSRTNKDLPLTKSKPTGRVDDDDDDDEWAGGVHLGVPVQIFALVSAISGALVVLLVFFVCCCIVRNLSRRNLMQRQSPSQRTIEINLSQASNQSIDHVRSEIPMHGLVRKSNEDLPPAYEAIFPEPMSQKR